jgi:hypothetical protein
VNIVTDKEKKILDTFGKAIPNLTESEKERLLIFGEAISMIRDKPQDTGQENPHKEKAHSFERA